MTERKLASIQRIVSIRPIEGADAIEVARVLNWDIVVKKNEFTAGEFVVYFEIDSWIPTQYAPFLSKGKEPRVYEGVSGERLRTIKLRGQISQGLILPISAVLANQFIVEDWEGHDLTEFLGIKKWEAPIPAQLAGRVRGNFPMRIAKTDQERIQNLTKLFETGELQKHTYEITEKCEGSSDTMYILDGVFGVCSRNLDLTETEDNTFWQVARSYPFEEKLREFGQDVAIQGELIGPGVQDNIYGLQTHQFRLFTVQLPNEGGREMLPKERRAFAERFGFLHAPVIETEWSFEGKTIDDVIAMATGQTAITSEKKQLREGLVFKSNDSKLSFKSISNEYLAKQG